MSKFIQKSACFFILLCAFTFLNTQNANAQRTKWLYSMVMDGKTYKINFQQERGTLTIQLYASSTNKWNFATILSSNQDGSNGKTTYYKVKDSVNNNIYEMWSNPNGTLLVKSGKASWTYYLEK